MDLPKGPDTVADLEFTENSEESSGKKTGNDTDITEAQNESEIVTSTTVSHRRDLLNAKVSSYKQEKLKMNISDDNQLLNCAREDLIIKKRIVDQMDKTDKNYTKNKKKSSNMEKLTNSIADGFSLLKNLLMPEQPIPMNSHVQKAPQRHPQTVWSSADPDPSVTSNNTGNSQAHQINNFSAPQRYSGNQAQTYTIPQGQSQRQTVNPTRKGISRGSSTYTNLDRQSRSAKTAQSTVPQRFGMYTNLSRSTHMDNAIQSSVRTGYSTFTEAVLNDTVEEDFEH